MDADYMRRFEEANRQFNDYIKAATAAILTFSRSLSSFFPYCRIVLSRKEYSYILKKQEFEKYEITEKLFPKKKKRGSMRRARIERKWGKFNDPPLPDGVYIDEWLVKNDQPMIPPVSREEFMQKASFSAPWPGPFEGEENFTC